ncbi:phosphoglycolate phosphatase [Kineosphaera limosa]|uniref:Putative hydrolase n=1 Tax=Kineosphaera limosa NBRC 100340 TaxID=1184609 RepID=K6WL04_9MICO|nr:HAD hydrolase-like protein [Kineosphaera limosa]NYE03149.1 phosphoglycolate phosphatase [Kineosphaera limosa]GAB94486.1 putative hydrolase [Kineosphaera limosa NBRC 100340]
MDIPNAADTRAVGFDLDLTLVDTRERILASAVNAFADLGASIPAEAIVPHLGIPLADKVAALAPALDTPAFVAAYRDHYHRPQAPQSPAMPGALAALQAVRAAGDRAIVVTAKIEWMGRGAVTEAGLADELDAVHGSLFALDKATALLAEGAWVYVGDHPGDIHAAHAADAVAVGVTTGANDEAALRAAGADVVLESLTEFAAWYAQARP